MDLLKGQRIENPMIWETLMFIFWMIYLLCRKLSERLLVWPEQRIIRLMNVQKVRNVEENSTNLEFLQMAQHDNLLKHQIFKNQF